MSSPHRFTLTEMVRKHQWRTGAELGVDKGILLEMLLSSCPSLEHLIGVDTGVIPTRWERCEAIREHHLPRCTLFKSTTSEASAWVPDQSLDFVFIDADHSYQAVTDDIQRWRTKVRAGGWIGGHDYNDKFPGVVKAVDRIFGRKVELRSPGSIWGVWL